MAKIIKFNDNYAYRTAFTEAFFYATMNNFYIHDVNKNFGKMYDEERGIMVSTLHPYQSIKIEGNDQEKIKSLESKILKIKEKEDTPDKLSKVA